jgi:hypothetical protein
MVARNCWAAWPESIMGSARGSSPAIHARIIGVFPAMQLFRYEVKEQFLESQLVPRAKCEMPRVFARLDPHPVIYPIRLVAGASVKTPFPNLRSIGHLGDFNPRWFLLEYAGPTLLSSGMSFA